jgi:hypothetical protein
MAELLQGLGLVTRPLSNGILQAQRNEVVSLDLILDRVAIIKIK